MEGGKEGRREGAKELQAEFIPVYAQAFRRPQFLPPLSVRQIIYNGVGQHQVVLRVVLGEAMADSVHFDLLAPSLLRFVVAPRLRRVGERRHQEKSAKASKKVESVRALNVC